ncbi:MAG: HNH endonuclease [Campylobacterales bacterium]|nr:HNH endonuclease [Campylobacterales bacterium]
MYSVHKKKPIRTCKKSLERYTSYRSYIKEDFHHSCGYCGDSDEFYGHYHIDHFKPQGDARFVHLKTEYSNLVYSCPFCNLSKSDTWLDQDEFIDPCCATYDSHLKRNDKGKIEPITKNGKNMYKHMKLYLLRHELIWVIEKILVQQEELLKLRDTLEEDSDKLKVADAFIELQNTIKSYTRLYME